MKIHAVTRDQLNYPVSPKAFIHIIYLKCQKEKEKDKSKINMIKTYLHFQMVLLNTVYIDCIVTIIPVRPEGISLCP